MFRELALRVARFGLNQQRRQGRSTLLTMVSAWLAGQLWNFDNTWRSLIKEGYGKNAVAYACLRLLSQSVPEAKLVAYKTRGAKRKPLADDHELMRLLQRPNELMTQFEFVELTTIQMAVVGRSVWWKERSVAGKTINLWPLRPDRVAPIYSDSSQEGQKVVAGYSYLPPDAGTPIPLRRGDVVAFNFPDPDGETGGIVEGLGPMSVMRWQLSADNKATEHVGALMANYAMPSVALKLTTPVDETQAGMIKAKFKQEFGGANAGAPAILDSGAEIEALGFSLRDLEFPDLRTNAEARICACLGVPPMLIGVKAGLDSATYSNVENARRYFAETTLSHYWRRYADQLTNDLAAEYGEAFYVEFDTSEVRALAGQKVERLAPIKEAFSAGAITVNMYITEMGLDPLPPDVGDVLYVPTSVTVVPATEEARRIIAERAAKEQQKQLAQQQQAQSQQFEQQKELAQNGHDRNLELTDRQFEQKKELVQITAATKPKALPAGNGAKKALDLGESEVLVVAEDDLELLAALGLQGEGEGDQRPFVVRGGPSSIKAAKFNPYHDNRGRFTSGSGAGGAAQGPAAPVTMRLVPEAPEAARPAVAATAQRLKAAIAAHQGVWETEEIIALGKMIDDGLAEATADLAARGQAVQAQVIALAKRRVDTNSADPAEKAQLEELIRQENALTGEVKAIRETFALDTLSQVRPMGAEFPLSYDTLYWGQAMPRLHSEAVTVMREAQKYFPREWQRVSNAMGPFDLFMDPNNRGSYNPDAKRLMLATGSTGSVSRTVAIHELAHRFEDVVPGVQAQVRDFYTRRTRGEQLEWLGPPYAKNELTRKDNWFDPYIGKDYKGKAYEVLSTGMEAVFGKGRAAASIDEDPELRQFVYGLLASA